MSDNFQNAFHSFSRNSSHVIEGVYDIAPLDVSFILLCGFMIFTMQTGEIKEMLSVQNIYVFLMWDSLK